jgi:hypothetical protein
MLVLLRPWPDRKNDMWQRQQLREACGPTILIGFAGDTLLGYPDGKPVALSPALLQCLRECDHFLVNQEGPLTTAPPQAKGSVGALGAPPSCCRQLIDLHVTIANLANNHSMDHGGDGLAEAIGTLRGNGILTVGAGPNAEKAGEPLIIPMPFGSLAMISTAWPDGPEASADTPGAMPLDPRKVLSQISHLRSRGHMVCAMSPGGEDIYRIPRPARRRMLLEFARAGAQIVIGGHSHIFQGIEVAHGAVIAYGFGNFYLNIPYMRTLAFSDIGLVMGLELDEQGPCAIRTLFVQTDRDAPSVNLLCGAQREAAQRILDEISAPSLWTERRHMQAWRHACLRRLMGKAHVGEAMPSNALRAFLGFSRLVMGFAKASVRNEAARDLLASGLLGLVQSARGYQPPWRENELPDTAGDC